MNLSKVERLLLINQYRIRKAIEGSNDYDEIIEILSNGYASRYYEAFNEVYDEVTVADCKFVSDVLSMYRRLHYFEQDKGVDLSGRLFSRFAGFCGNEEGPLLSYAQFAIGREGHWDEQKPRRKETDGYNSHMPVREVYARMLEVFNRCGHDPLTTQQVDEILAAAPHPSARRSS